MNIFKSKAHLAEDIKKRFDYYPPTKDQAEKLEDFRRSIRLLAYNLIKLTPECREQSLALTHLEEFLFWVSAAIMRDRDV